MSSLHLTSLSQFILRSFEFAGDFEGIVRILASAFIGGQQFLSQLGRGIFILSTNCQSRPLRLLNDKGDRIAAPIRIDEHMQSYALFFKKTKLMDFKE